MKKSVKFIVMLMMVLFTAGMIASCSPSYDIEVGGKWNFTITAMKKSVEAKATITDRKLKIVDRVGGLGDLCIADIVEYRNDTFNNNETGSGDYGYAVVQFKGGMLVNYVLGVKDKYGIFRWENLNGKSCSFLIAGEEEDGTPKLHYKDTLDLAKSDLNNTSGFISLPANGVN